MAQQIDKGSVRNQISAGTKKFAKKLQNRKRRRHNKNLENHNFQDNRYSDGWVM